MDNLRMVAEVSRRSFVRGSAALGFSVFASSANAQSQFRSEQQWAGEGAESEILSYDPEKVSETIYGGSKADYAPRDMDFSAHFLASCQNFIGNSRAATPERIADYLALFDLKFKDGNGKYVPFCAAGASFAAAHAYVKNLARPITPATEIKVLRNVLGEIDRYHFYPSPSVWDMVYVAQGKRRWITRGDADFVKPGWLVIYDWEKNGGANHVGVVEKRDGAKLHTIEFNTAAQPGSGSESNGGLVTRRTRNFDGTVKGFIQTDKKAPFDKDT